MYKILSYHHTITRIHTPIIIIIILNFKASQSAAAALIVSLPQRVFIPPFLQKKCAVYLAAQRLFSFHKEPAVFLRFVVSFVTFVFKL